MPVVAVGSRCAALDRAGVKKLLGAFSFFCASLSASVRGGTDDSSTRTEGETPDTKTARKDKTPQGKPTNRTALGR